MEPRPWSLLPGPPTTQQPHQKQSEQLSQAMVTSPRPSNAATAATETIDMKWKQSYKKRRFEYTSILGQIRLENVLDTVSQFLQHKHFRIILSHLFQESANLSLSKPMNPSGLLKDFTFKRNLFSGWNIFSAIFLLTTPPGALSVRSSKLGQCFLSRYSTIMQNKWWDVGNFQFIIVTNLH